MIWLLSTMALGADITEVKEGETVTGPGVFLTEVQFRIYVTDSRNLASCREDRDEVIANLNTAVDRIVAADKRALDAAKIAEQQFKVDEQTLQNQLQTIAELGAKLDQESRRNVRVRNQRNVAWAISGGFLAASTAAVVLSLD